VIDVQIVTIISYGQQNIKKLFTKCTAARKQPIMMSCTPQPAILGENIRSFLEKQNDLCEKFVQVGVAFIALDAFACVRAFLLWSYTL